VRVEVWGGRWVWGVMLEEGGRLNGEEAMRKEWAKGGGECDLVRIDLWQ